MKTLGAWAGAIRHAWAIARATPALSLLVVVALAAALALPLLAAAVAEGALAALAALARIDAKPTVSIFLTSAAGPRERESVVRALRGEPAVAAVRFIPRQQALAQLSGVEGVGDLLAGLDANPLPDTFVATLADADPGTATAVGGRIRALPVVGAVQSDVA